jgi:hypothetical protein
MPIANGTPGHSKPPSVLRDENLQRIRRLGRAQWEKYNNYHRHSLAETTLFRFKQIFGGRLAATLFERQYSEAFNKIPCSTK